MSLRISQSPGAASRSEPIMKDRSPSNPRKMSSLDLYMKLVSFRSFKATPVSTFSHVPLAWEFDKNIVEGLIVEVQHVKEESSGTTAVWLAVIVRKVSYLVQLKWLGDQATSSERYFWRHIAIFKEPSKNQLDLRVFPLGWANAHNKRLEPPKDIQDFQLSWQDFIKEELRSSDATLPEDFHEAARKDNESCFKSGMEVEATALENMSVMKPARVEGDIGRRIMFRYLDGPGIPKFCWFNEFSGMFMPCGWSWLHGNRSILDFPYVREVRSMLKESSGESASIFEFKPVLVAKSFVEALLRHRIELGSKLEVVDPSEPQCIRVGTIVDVLKNWYLVIRVDGVNVPDGGEHRICLHASSPHLLPAGFAAENNLLPYFKPPTEKFSYEEETVVPREILSKEIPPHDFETNQFLEACLWGTDRIYLSRIVRVVGHLVIVRFEGFDARDDRFFPMSSPDLYPVGWCHLVGHTLLSP